MILQPAKTFNGRMKTTRQRYLPAAFGGINAVSPLNQMPPEDALELTDMFPRTDSVRVRNGYTSWATGIGGAVHALMEWSGPASRKFFAAKASSIYNITSTGAVGAADVTGLTNGQWQQVMMATSGGNFLVIANGADSVRNYDGTTWTTPVITGLTSSTAINLFIHKRRIWFIEKNTLNTWYLPVDSVAGAATKIDLGPVFALGGKLVSGGSMTRDGGAGPDDLACFITDRGEVAVYQGTDPASASTWAIVGVFQISPPIGSRCVQKLGGDLSIITEGGVISLMAMFALDRSAQDRAAITNKINRLFADDAKLYKANFGWQSISYPRGTMVIVNVADIATTWQYVMNSINGSWCKFTYPARCWGLYKEDIYFGDDSGTVWKADSGQKNAGTTLVSGYMSMAFNHLGNAGHRKHAQMIRPIIESGNGTSVTVGISTDFDILGNSEFTVSNYTSNGSWFLTNMVGESFSPRIQIAAVEFENVDVYGFDLIGRTMTGHYR